MINTDLPPAMFEVDAAPPQPVVGKTPRELHEGLGGTIGEWRRKGYCASARWDWHPNPTTGWYGAHVCTKTPGHHGDCKCDRCDRTWGPIDANEGTGR